MLAEAPISRSKILICNDGSVLQFILFKYRNECNPDKTSQQSNTGSMLNPYHDTGDLLSRRNY